MPHTQCLVCHVGLHVKIKLQISSSSLAVDEEVPEAPRWNSCAIILTEKSESPSPAIFGQDMALMERESLVPTIFDENSEKRNGCGELKTDCIVARGYSPEDSNWARFCQGTRYCRFCQSHFKKDHRND